MDVAAIVPTYRRPKLLNALLTSLFSGDRKPDQVLIIDNDPRDSCYATWPSAWPVDIIRARLGLNLAGARNIGWRAAVAELCVFIDDDNIVAPDALEHLVRAAAEPGVGLVGPVIYDDTNPDRIWCGGVTRSMWTTRTTFLYRGQVLPAALKPWPTDEMPDAFCVRRRILEAIGGFDDTRFPFHYDEADLGVRIRNLGLRTIVAPSAAAWHSGGTSSDPGIEMSRAYELSGRRRVELMIYARVAFHRLNSRGIQRLVAIGVFIPIYVVLVAIAVLGRSNPAVGASVVLAMLRGLREGYGGVLGSIRAGTANKGL